jgi:hypothetical protein
MVISFSLIGPLPCIHLTPTKWTVRMCVAMLGISDAILIVSSFARAHLTVLDNGYDDNISTSLLVSGIY